MFLDRKRWPACATMDWISSILRSRMRTFPLFILSALLVSPGNPNSPSLNAANPPNPQAKIFGFHDAGAEVAAEQKVLMVPDPKRAEEHLRILTQAPHMAGTMEDKATADYVAKKFREA